ncbi:MAG: sulfotransferase [Planctomycetes bacterium]|nr:sulfotransferase [Planctomycetota bacterium]
MGNAAKVIQRISQIESEIIFWKIRRKLFNTIAGLVRRILAPVEAFVIRRYATEEAKYPPIFIIGAPRAGSTILYEYMTNYLDIMYINNFMCRFNKILYLASVASKIIFRGGQHNCFDSEHGATNGWNSPSECGGFWYRWFPRDKHFVDSDELDNIQISQIREVVVAIINKHNKPILFKNMNCGQRLRIIKNIFPNALFIYCKRDPLFTAQSIIESRERIHKNRQTWWSIMPREYDKLLKLDYCEQVVKQIYYIQKQIEKDADFFEKKQFIEIWYEDFCKLPKSIIEDIRSFLSQNGVSTGYRAEVAETKIRLSQQRRIDKQTYNRLSKLVESLDWGS